MTGVIRGEGFTRIKIAIPKFIDSPPSLKAEREEMRSTILADLTFSGYFNPIKESTYSLVTGFSASNPLCEEWTAVGADVTVIGTLQQVGQRLTFESRLFDNPSKKMISGKSYRGSLGIARRIGHKAANDIILYFTGMDGVGLTRIAFVAKSGKAKEIFLMDYDGKRIRQLTKSGTINLSPTWSPDGDKLAFISFRSGATGVCVMDSLGKLSTIMMKRGELNSAPDWSPDGRYLVFSSNESGNSEIYRLEVASGNKERLTFHPAIDSSPCWSPKGREIVFTSDRSGSPQLYIIDAEGTNVRRLTYEGSYNDSAAWSPKGDKIVYVSRVEGVFEIFLYDLNKGITIRLTRGSRNNENPRWSPDGRHIVFASNRKGSYDIFSMNFEGTDQKQLTSMGNCLTPDWSR
jgi:TolB protein